MRITLLLIALLPALATAEPAPLRYKLKPNKELVFRFSENRRSATQPSSTGAIRQNQETVRVVGQNADGSWRLVQEQRRLNNDTLTPSSHLDALLAFTLMPDGRATVDPEMAGNPNQIFIQLPADPMDEKWEANGEKGMVQHARRTPATEPNVINIDLEEDGLFSQAYAWKIRGTARFETNRGLITYQSWTSDYPKQAVFRSGKMMTADIVADTTMTLVSDEMRDPAWMRQYGEEIDVYSAARSRFFNTLREEKAAAAENRFDPATHDAAVAAFKSATASLTQPGISD